MFGFLGGKDKTHPDFPHEKHWTVVADEGVSWRASPDFQDKAAGKGPSVGDQFNTNTCAQIGDSNVNFFIKAKVGNTATFMYLPLDGPDGAPLVRPTVERPSDAEDKLWEVVFDGGVGIRRSNLYDDKDPTEAGLQDGQTFRGYVVPPYNPGEPDMIRITHSSDSVSFVPLTTKGGDDICQVAEGNWDNIEDYFGKADMSPREVGFPILPLIIHTPGETCGMPLAGTGVHKWPGSIEMAVELAVKCGHTPGNSIRYIQHAGDLTYFYAGGACSGKGGAQHWRLDPDANAQFKITHTPGETCGEHLQGSGEHRYPRTFTEALQIIKSHGHSLGRDCRYVEESKGKLYFYRGGGSLKGGEKHFRLDGC